MKLLFTLFAFCIFTRSYAGFTKGNGGNILKCQVSQNIVLDYFEMSEYHKFNLSNEFNNPQKFFELAAKKLTIVNEQLAQQFNNEFKDLTNRLNFIEVTEMGKVNDNYVVFIPSDCELQQTAIQIYPRILISKPIFQTLDILQQNILILHEVIYAAMISKRQLNDSRPVRALVGLILSQELNSMSKSAIASFLEQNNI